MRDGVQHVKPMIRYYGGGGGNDQLIERNKYVFYFARYPPVNQYTQVMNIRFMTLLWKTKNGIKLVLNYNRNKVELYINGNLERTFVNDEKICQYIMI